MFFIHVAAQFLQELVGFGQVFAAGAFALEEVRDGIQAEAVDAHVGPVVERAHDGAADQWIVEIQVRLVGKEAMPVVGFGDGVPAPVGRFKVFEDDTDAVVFAGGFAPDIEVAPAGTRGGAAGALKPFVLV